MNQSLRDGCLDLLQQSTTDSIVLELDAEKCELSVFYFLAALKYLFYFKVLGVAVENANLGRFGEDTSAEGHALVCESHEYVGRSGSWELLETHSHVLKQLFAALSEFDCRLFEKQRCLNVVVLTG